jgi:hypothetical protein
VVVIRVELREHARGTLIEKVPIFRLELQEHARRTLIEKVPIFRLEPHTTILH